MALSPEQIEFALRQDPEFMRMLAEDPQRASQVRSLIFQEQGLPPAEHFTRLDLPGALQRLGTPPSVFLPTPPGTEFMPTAGPFSGAISAFGPGSRQPELETLQAPVGPRFPLGATALAIPATMAASRFTRSPTAIEGVGTLAAGAGDLIQSAAEFALRSPHAPSSVEEAFQRASQEGILQGAFGFGGRLVGRVLRFVTEDVPNAFRFGDQITDEGREIIQFTQRDPDLQFRLAEVTSSRGAQLLDNIAKFSLFGGGMIERMERNRERFFSMVADDVLDLYRPGRDPASTSQLLVKTLDQDKQVALIPAKAMRNAVENAVAPSVDHAGQIIPRTGFTVPSSPLKQAHLALERQITAPLQGLGSSERGDKIIRTILEMPDDVEMLTLMRLRTALREEAEAIATSGGSKTVAFTHASRLERRVNRLIEAGLRVHPNQSLLRMWQAQNKLFAEGGEQFSRIFLRRLIRRLDLEGGGNPDQLLQVLTGPRGGTRIQLLRDALLMKGVKPDLAHGLTDAQIRERRVQGERRLREIAEAYLTDVFDQATKQGTEPHRGLAVLSRTVGRTGIGEKGLRLLLGPDQANALTQFAKTMVNVQERRTTGAGRVFVALMQPGAFLGLSGKAVQIIGGYAGVQGLEGGGLIDTVTDATALLGVGILFGPAAMAKIFTNKRATMAMLQAARHSLPADFETSLSIAARAISALVDRDVSPLDLQLVGGARLGQLPGTPPLPALPASTQTELRRPPPP